MEKRVVSEPIEMTQESRSAISAHRIVGASPWEQMARSDG
jgi:hypothetical protein